MFNHLISCWVSGSKAPPPNNTLVLGDWIPSLFRLLYKASLSRLDLEHSSKTCLVSRAMLRWWVCLTVNPSLVARPCCVYVSEDQPRRSLDSVQGGDGVFNQVLPKHSQAKTQVSQTWIYNSVEFINCINFPWAGCSRILETSTGCEVVINKVSYDAPILSAMTHHSYLSIHVSIWLCIVFPTFVKVYWSAGGDERCLPGYEGRIGKVT